MVDCSRRRLVLAGLGLLLASLALGIVLHNNQDGIGIDRWFQRQTAAGARRPGQPGFHYRLFRLLTRTTNLGTGFGLACFAVVIVALLGLAVWFVARHRRRSQPVALAAVLAPLVALAVAGFSAEGLLKGLIGRRMTDNLSVLTYPSGHAVATAAVASAAVVVLLRLRTAALAPRLWRPTLVVLAVLLAAVPVVIGLEMAVLRAHYLTDVIGGWAWGCGWGLLVGAAFTWRARANSGGADQASASASVPPTAGSAALSSPRA